MTQNVAVAQERAVRRHCRGIDVSKQMLLHLRMWAWSQDALPATGVLSRVGSDVTPCACHIRRLLEDPGQRTGLQLSQPHSCRAWLARQRQLKSPPSSWKPQPYAWRRLSGWGAQPSSLFRPPAWTLGPMSKDYSDYLQPASLSRLWPVSHPLQETSSTTSMSPDA